MMRYLRNGDSEFMNLIRMMVIIFRDPTRSAEISKKCDICTALAAVLIAALLVLFWHWGVSIISADNGYFRLTNVTIGTLSFVIGYTFMHLLALWMGGRGKLAHTISYGGAVATAVGIPFCIPLGSTQVSPGPLVAVAATSWGFLPHSWFPLSFSFCWSVIALQVWLIVSGATVVFGRKVGVGVGLVLAVACLLWVTRYSNGDWIGMSRLSLTGFTWLSMTTLVCVGMREIYDLPGSKALLFCPFVLAPVAISLLRGF